MNDKEVRNMLENEQVPEELEPENIKKMLDEKAPAVKRKRITAASRFAAVAAACAVVSGTAVHFAGQGNKIDKTSNIITTEQAASIAGNSGETPHSPAPAASAPYMTGAEDYSQIYSMFREASENYRKTASGTRYYGNISGIDMAVEEEAMEDGSAVLTGGDASVQTNGDPKTAEPPGTSKGDENEHSDTFNQEEGVLEADIVKTDGNYIYTLKRYDYNTSNPGRINIVPVNDGEFGEVATIDPYSSLKDIIPKGHNYSIELHEMYLYNDMIIVIGNLRTYADKNAEDYYTSIYGGYDTNSKNGTFVAAYSTDDSHNLIGTYYQDGWFNDVRISPEGYLLLITNYASCSFDKVENADDTSSFIPTTGMAEAVDFIAPEDILMPDEGFDDLYQLSYTVISSLDLNENGSITETDSKALAGYSGQVYCSAENLYTAVYKYDYDLPEDVEYGFTTDKTTQTRLTRIAINGGQITPAASGKIDGAVDDQFSMSEYNGYFRVAATCNEYTMTYTKGVCYDYYTFDEEQGSYIELEKPEYEEYGYYEYTPRKQDNRLYVLDLNLDIVGSVGDFGIDESVKSVNFNGDMAYVVTYEQTDPLFAIDLSDPTAPKILDEFKMLGYSSYMQRWSDDLLLGFGPNADEKGVENGLKLVMFDNSDPNDLRLTDSVVLEMKDYEWFYSDAVYDRKALFIAPEKELVGFPLFTEDYSSDDWSCRSLYRFYYYRDGKFTPAGEIKSVKSDSYSKGGDISFNRALYIGGYIYAVSETSIYSADIESFTLKDKVSF